MNRLIADNTTGTGAHNYAYSYDSRGNILTNNETGTTITHTYDAASRLTTSIEGSVITTYTFDNNGNLNVVEKGSSVANMTYDPENQMGSHEDENGDATYYSYDPNMHLKQDVHLAGTTRWFVWLDDLIVRQDDTSGLKRIFTVNDGVIVGEVYSVTSHAQTRSYLEDFLGSVTGEMSTSNAVSNSRRFTPYGRDWLGAATVPHSPAYVGGHGYHPTGLKWAGYSVFHRIVTPETGQWTTRDMLWPEEWAYAYVNGNPTTWVDPSGLDVGLIPTMDEEMGARLINQYLNKIRGSNLKQFYECIKESACRTTFTLPEKGKPQTSASEVAISRIKAILSGYTSIKVEIEIVFDEPRCKGRCMYTERPDDNKNQTKIVICHKNSMDFRKCGPRFCQLLHEIIHAAGYGASDNAALFGCMQYIPGCERFQSHDIAPWGGW